MIFGLELCKICNKKMDVRKYIIVKNKTYCSKKCFEKHTGLKLFDVDFFASDLMEFDGDLDVEYNYKNKE